MTVPEAHVTYSHHSRKNSCILLKHILPTQMSQNIQNDKTWISRTIMHLFFPHIPNTCKEEKYDQVKPFKLILCHIQFYTILTSALINPSWILLLHSPNCISYTILSRLHLCTSLHCHLGISNKLIHERWYSSSNIYQHIMNLIFCCSVKTTQSDIWEIPV